MINRNWQVPGVLIPIILIGGALWAFIEILDEVVEGETRSIDEAILLGFRVPGDPADPIGEPWFEEAMRDITALGSAPTLVIAVLAVVGFLMLAKAWRPAIFTLVASGGGLIVSSLLKYTVDRPRPDLVPHGNLIYTTSFPSGHSMMSAVVYLDAGRLGRAPDRAQTAEGLRARRRDDPDAAGRRVAHLSRRALAVGCDGGLGGGRRLGARLLADRALDRPWRRYGAHRMIKDRHTMSYLRTQIAMLAVLACLNADSAIAEGPVALSAAADHVVQEYLEKVRGGFGALAVSSDGQRAVYHLCKSRQWKNCDDYALADRLISIPSGHLAGKRAMADCGETCVLLYVNDTQKQAYTVE